MVDTVKQRSTFSWQFQCYNANNILFLWTYILIWGFCGLLMISIIVFMCLISIEYIICSVTWLYFHVWHLNVTLQFYYNIWINALFFNWVYSPTVAAINEVLSFSDNRAIVHASNYRLNSLSLYIETWRCHLHLKRPILSVTKNQLFLHKMI